MCFWDLTLLARCATMGLGVRPSVIRSGVLDWISAQWQSKGSVVSCLPHLSLCQRSGYDVVSPRGFPPLDATISGGQPTGIGSTGSSPGWIPTPLSDGSSVVRETAVLGGYKDLSTAQTAPRQQCRGATYFVRDQKSAI